MRVHPTQALARNQISILSRNTPGVDFRIYARDVEKTSKKKGEDVIQKRVVKEFVTGARDEIIHIIFAPDYKLNNYYELIPARTTCRFPIDCDMKLQQLSVQQQEQNIPVLGNRVIEAVQKMNQQYWEKGTKGIEELLCKARVCIRNTVEDVLMKLLPDIQIQDTLELLDASSCEGKMKFSLHIHTPLLLEDLQMDGSVLARSLNAATNLGFIQKANEAEQWTESFLISLLFMWDWETPPVNEKTLACSGVADVCVYRKNQLFRMYGNAKMGTKRYLLGVDEEGNKIPLPKDIMSRENIFSEKYEVVPSVQALYLAREHCTPLRLCPSDGLWVGPTCCRLLAQRKQSGESGYLLQIPLWESRHQLLRSQETANVTTAKEGVVENSRRIHSFNGQWNANTSYYETSKGKGIRHGSHMIILSNFQLFDENGTPISAKDIEDENLTVHCPICDCHAPKSDGKIQTASGVPDLNPSAKTWKPDLGGSFGIYCFCCSTFFVVCLLNEYDGFTEEATIYPMSGKYLSENFLSSVVSRERSKINALLQDSGTLLHLCEPPIKRRRTVGRGTSPKENHILLVAVNAPMGSGKTEAAVLLSTKPWARQTLILTYRRSLSRQLQDRFTATNYLDIEGPLTSDVMGGALVVCVNSIRRVPQDREFDLVVVDEAGFTRRHFVSGTFGKPGFMDYIDPLDSLLKCASFMSRAKTVLIMQEGLTNDDVDFYRDVIESNSGIRPRVTVRKLYAPRIKDVEKYDLTRSFSLWLLALKHTIREGKRVFITCSQRSMAEVLRPFVLGVCRPTNKSKEDWESLVALVTSGVVLPRTPGLQCSEDFVRFYKRFHVAIVTSSLESGISLSSHYDVVFPFCSRSPLTFPVQVQLTQRVRDAARTLVYAEKGEMFHMFQDRNKLFEHLKGVVPSRNDALLVSTLAVLESETADTFNHNDILWEVNRSPTDMDTLDVQNSSSRLLHWIPDVSTSKLKKMKQEVFSEFRIIATKRNFGIARYVCLANEDAHILQHLELLEKERALSHSVAHTSYRKRRQLGEIIGKPCKALHELLSRELQYGKQFEDWSTSSDFLLNWKRDMNIVCTYFFCLRLDFDLSTIVDSYPMHITGWKSLSDTLTNMKGHSGAVNKLFVEIFNIFNLVDYAVSTLVLLFGNAFPKANESVVPDESFLLEFCKKCRHWRNSPLFSMVDKLPSSLTGKHGLLDLNDGKYSDALKYMKKFLMKFGRVRLAVQKTELKVLSPSYSTLLASMSLNPLSALSTFSESIPFLSFRNYVHQVCQIALTVHTTKKPDTVFTQRSNRTVSDSIDVDTSPKPSTQILFDDVDFSRDAAEIDCELLHHVGWYDLLRSFSTTLKGIPLYGKTLVPKDASHRNSSILRKGSRGHSPMNI